MPRKGRRDKLMVSVWAHVGAARIEEAWIADKREFIAGLCEHGPNGRITVNPIYDVVSTLVHECLHALEPSWTENYVRRTTTFLMRRMTDDEIIQLYHEYNKRKRKRATVKKLS